MKIFPSSQYPLALACALEGHCREEESLPFYKTLCLYDCFVL